MLRILIFIVSVLVAPGTARSDNAQALAAAMVGSFETKPGDPDNNFLDQRAALAPLGPGQWVYLQLNSGPTRKLYRQRVLQLTNQADGTVLQKAWTFKTPGLFADILTQPEKRTSLSLGDLSLSFEEQSCGMVWHRAQNEWVGQVDYRTCQIFSKRRNTMIGIGAETRLSAGKLLQTERGYNADGEQIWGSKPGSYAELLRHADVR